MSADNELLLKVWWKEKTRYNKFTSAEQNHKMLTEQSGTSPDRTEKCSRLSWRLDAAHRLFCLSWISAADSIGLFLLDMNLACFCSVLEVAEVKPAGDSC